ncbi:wall-associated receptor kinase-like 14 [Cornus florida]|uniref:wall-associated receptor kinase-like 14 n=1 Tax=Cornus florida TaxID=4283 RepID=UPI002896CC54|nr:wall-associated receptor kinase-like 14 [Cornus florida]
MLLNLQIIIIFAICIVPVTIIAQTPTKCNASCGISSAKHLPFPFGFSAGCPFRLNCTSTGDILIHDFPVQKVTPDVILINLPAKCDRPITALHHLFGQNYAPTSCNGILLQNCSLPIKPCLIPTTTIQTHFELLDCVSEKGNNISCYSEQNNQSRFVDYTKVIQSGCVSLFSAISLESLGNNLDVSIDVQAVQLGWWLEGDCDCSPNANCSMVESPVGKGYRCRCLEGFVGDGFPAGLGCRKGAFQLP